MIGSEDSRRKLLSSVLLVGGGLGFRGAGAYLQSRLGPGAEVRLMMMMMMMITRRMTFPMSIKVSG